jgi:asparagine synthase (glutamine-hydrolysing)
MESADGRFVVVFNGEIYNFRRLRAELEPLGHRFRGTSDTEVVIAAVAQWGVRGALERFVGMFAFGLWDRRERTLTLARDQIGGKPLYYGSCGGVTLFGSVLSALRAHPSFDRPVDRGALALLLRFDYIEAPHTIYEGIRKLPQGTFLTLRAGDDPLSAVPETYWSARDIVTRGPSVWKSPEEALERLEALLRDAVELQMISDVPLGAFLSGGIDSSLIVALMQEVSRRPVRTFTIGFREEAFNEADHARAVAKHLGTDHTEQVLTAADALALVPRIPEMYDEPFADPSQLPTHLVARLARQSVTVVLSGDGGDELFGGYNKYPWAGRVWRGVSWVPRPLRRAAARALLSVSSETWDRIVRLASPVLPRRFTYGSPGTRVHKVARLAGGRTPQDAYLQVMSHWDRAVVPGAVEPPVWMTDPSRWPAGRGYLEWMMCADLMSYLPDDGIVKVDRATMAVSLEARAPILDHRVAEFAWSMPVGWRIRDGVGKWPLRELLYRRVPRDMVDRPKQGFAVPVGPWLRGALRDWAEALLAEDRLRREGFLDPAAVRRVWTEHASGRRDWSFHLWPVLMFQAWLERQ